MSRLDRPAAVRPVRAQGWFRFDDEQAWHRASSAGTGARGIVGAFVEHDQPAEGVVQLYCDCYLSMLPASTVRGSPVT